MSLLAEFLLRTLLEQIRYGTVRQLARFCDVTVEEMRAETDRMMRAGLLVKRICTAPEPVELIAPVDVWWPGTERTDDNFRSLARQLATRGNMPSIELPVVAAAQFAADILDGDLPGKGKKFQSAHDLACCEMLIAQRWLEGATYHRPGRFHALPPIMAVSHVFSDWKGEDWLVRNGLSFDGYVPDLGLVIDGDLICALEYGGLYPASRLKQIHESVSNYERADGRKAAYYIW